MKFSKHSVDVGLVETLIQHPNFSKPYKKIQFSDLETCFVNYKFMSDLEYPVGRYITMNFPWLNEVSAIINEIVSYLKVRKIVLLCRGSSGSIISTHVANYLHVRDKDREILILHFKKDNENSHDYGYSSLYEDLIPNGYFIAIDDFIASGNTFKQIYNSFTIDCQKKTYFRLPIVDLLIFRNGFYHKMIKDSLRDLVQHSRLIISTFAYSDESWEETQKKFDR